MARLPVGRTLLCVRLFRAPVRVRGRAHQERQGLRRQPDGRRDPAVPRDVDRTGHEQSVPRSVRRREPRSVRADARGRISGRRPRAARENRHGVAQFQHARSDALPDPPRDTSPDRRHLVHLSDVRLRASAVGRRRAHHALALHSRVRGSPASVRLAGGQLHGRRGSAAADRIRAAQPELHGDEQAQAAAARPAEGRVRVGRSAHADDQRPAAPRVHPRIDSRLLFADRRREKRERDRHGPARARDPRGPERPRAARHGRAAPVESRHHELSGGTDRGRRRHQQPRGRGRGHAQGAVLARPLHRTRRFPRGSAEEILPPRARQGSAAAVRVFHYVHRRREGRSRRGRGTALHLRSAHPRRRFAGRTPREGDAALGVGRRTRSARRCGSTIGCSPSRTPRTRRKGRPSWTPSTRARWRCSPTPASSRASRQRCRARGFQFERLGYFCVDPDSKPGAPVFNRTVSLRDAWAKIEQRGAETKK